MLFRGGLEECKRNNLGIVLVGPRPKRHNCVNKLLKLLAEGKEVGQQRVDALEDKVGNILILEILKQDC